MPDRILHHTWSIRTMSSPLAIPLFSSQSSCASLQAMEEQLTICVRGSSAVDSVGSSSNVDGTFVTLEWIDLPLEDPNDEVDDDKEANNQAESNGKPSSRKRPRTTNNSLPPEIPTETASATCRHLYVDVLVEDEPVAQAVLCFARSTNESNHDVESFSFVLIHGKVEILETIMSWLKSTCGCSILPFSPTSSELLAVVWNKTQQTLENAEQKPLELTFAIPTHLASSGLEQFALTVPPLALTRLCRDMERRRQRQQRDTEEQQGQTAAAHLPPTDDVNTTESQQGGPKDARLPLTDDTGTDNKTEREGKDRSAVSNEDMMAEQKQRPPPPEEDTITTNGGGVATTQIDESSSNDNGQQELPILKAIQCYIWETFHINVQSFTLIRASSAVAALGCDGRCRPLDASQLSSTLSGIETMIYNRTACYNNTEQANSDDEEP